MAQTRTDTSDRWKQLKPWLVVAAATAVVLAVLFSFQTIFAPLAVALAVAYILNPVMRWGVRHKIPRGLMATGLFLAVVGFVALIVILAVPPLVGELVAFGYGMFGEPVLETEKLTDGLKDDPAVHKTEEGTWYRDVNNNEEYDAGHIQRLIAYIRDLREEAAADSSTWYAQVENWLTENRTAIGKSLVGTLQKAGTGILGLIEKAQNFLMALGLGAFYLFFLLLNFDRIVDTIHEKLPGRYRLRIEDVMGKINRAVSAFLRGRLLVCVCVGALTAVGLAVLGVPYWYLLGVATGLAGIVPFLPIFVGLVPSMLVGWLDTESLWVVGGVIIVFVAVQTIEGWVLTPLIQGKAVGLHPVTLIIALLLGYQALGLFGLIAAVPLAATVKILAREFVLPEVEELADEPPKTA